MDCSDMSRPVDGHDGHQAFIRTVDIGAEIVKRGPEEDRTPGLQNANLALSQLSYGPHGWASSAKKPSR